MNMRIGGLASGMDIDQIVKDLMKAERIPLNKMNQQKQVLEWQRDDYRSMNSLLLSLRDLSFNMKLSSTYRAKNTTSSNESKVTATASAAAGNVAYTLSKVDKLATAATKVNAGDIRKDKDSFDTNASIWSQKANFDNTGFNWKKGGLVKETKKITEPSKTVNLSNTNIKIDQESIDNMQVKVNGKSYTVVTDPTKLNENTVFLDRTNIDNPKLTFANNIEKGSTVSVDYFIDNYSQEITVPKPSDTATNPNTTFQLSKGSLSTEGMSIKVTTKAGGETTYTPIYSTSDWEAMTDKTGYVLVDQETGKLTFSTSLAEGDIIKADYKQNYFSFGLETFNENGESVKETFSVEGSSSLSSIMNRISSSSVGVNAFYDDFKGQVTLTRSQTGNFNTAGDEIKITGDFLNNVLQFSASTETGGNNAEFTINGLSTERHSNNFTINGVSFTLKDTFDTPVTVGVTTNTDTVVDNIVNFVEKYNETITKINEKLNEERYRSYQPLSSEEREALSDKEAELWEEKAKSGLIRRDSMLSSGLNQFRMDLYSPVTNLSVDSTFNQLASIGIKTTANYMDRGKLEIDKAKLKEAIEKNPEAVEKLFTADGSTYAEKGLVNRLYDSLTATMDKVSERAGKSTWTTQKYTIGKNLDRLDDSIDRFEDRLVQIEDRYWRQFTAMEKAIQRANQQSAYLMQQFSF
ncbi:flagellar filament capping protein FliD [Bacillus sp. REN16]|uniref:flagellar filament capping protein FliD n=1 Tax=Bacillus sp. REN16 TaxID=2887296 RepID=UPI001E5ECA7F|nr:flagellar filament capping protein FliD [Bacillus sp. REN16]MCC3356948.1 flagellar filament capping protein FliD [Bacillus sp. REN16]